MKDQVTIAFEKGDEVLETVSACANRIPGSRLKKMSKDKSFVHATVITMLWGFIDDLYISVDQTGDFALV